MLIDAAKAGFGGMVGIAAWGLIVLVGIVLMLANREPAQDGGRRALFWAGVALVVVGSLPFLPLLGVQMLADEF